MDDSEELSPSVSRIAEHLAAMAQGYDNHLKWNEQAKFKADLINARQRWARVTPAVFAARLRTEGMREEDIAELVEWLVKAQAGRRLAPQRTYRDFVFNPPPEARIGGPGRNSRVW